MAEEGVRRVPLRVLLPCLLTGIVVVSMWSVTTGALAAPLGDVLDVFAVRLHLRDVRLDPIVSTTVIDIRLPRIVMGLLVGSALGLCGAAMQGVFRNPLADPGLIGVSAGAGLGAVTAIVVGADGLGRLTVPVAAFLGALAISAAVYQLSRAHGRTNVVALLLTGIAVNAVVTAGIAFMIFRANDTQLRNITFWQLGSLATAKWSDVRLVAPFVVVGIVFIPRFARDLDAMALGEREARHVGVDPDGVRRKLIALCALVTGAAVALVGIVAFVGLVVPHLIRLISGPAHRSVLWGSIFGGALLVASADLAARKLVAPQELPLGVITALVGGMFFLYLLRRTVLRADVA